jgi:hypothetical protein
MAGCCGGGRPGLTVTTNGDGVAVERQTAAVPGMPRYEVEAPDGTITEHATYAEARIKKAAVPGSTMRPV